MDTPLSGPHGHTQSDATRVPRISVVIPAYNEQGYLPRLLDTVDVARKAYSFGPDAIEVIVADNVSTDTTAKIAADRGCTVVRVEKRVIGAVRNGGVRVARGHILAFIDADQQIHPDTFNHIERIMASGKYAVGATGITMERRSFPIVVTQILTRPLAWLGNFEQGVVFCTRGDFDTVGGYDEEKLFGEDVQFLRDLIALGRATGRKFSRGSNARTIFSTRKFDKFGDWHLLHIVVMSVYRLTFGRRSLKERRERFARMYWYDDQER